MSDSTVVEIGPRENPFVSELNPSLVSSNADILYVEKEAAWLAGLKKNKEQKGRIIQGDASHLFLAPKSVDTLVIKDVFGHQGTPEWLPGKGLTGRSIGTEKTSLDIVNEISRVLKDGGKAVVIETVTPYNFQKLKHDFEKAGLNTQIKYAKDNINKVYADPDFGDAMTMAAAPDSYAVVFEKIK